MAKEDLRKLQKQLIGYAEEIAESFNVKLDYSDESIKNVEKILSEIHLDYKKRKVTEGLEGIALEFGFYIMAVIEKNHGSGSIERNHEEFGENVFPFYWKDITVFPYEWCRKRIYDGKQDNVWSKYTILVSEDKKTEKKSGFFSFFSKKK